MTVQVITDSGADIPEQLATDLGILIVPLTVSFGNESYRDGIDLSADEFYRRLTEEETMPTTSQPSVGSFVEVYKKARASSDQVLSIHVSSKLSGTVNAARQAALEENLGADIELVDSSQASMGIGFGVIAAAEAVRTGASLVEAASVANSVIERTRVFILFDTLKYLEKGGRIGKASALLGSVLQLKPILTLEAGEIATKSKVRTFRKAVLTLEQLTQALGPLESLAVLYTTDKSEATQLGNRLAECLPENSNPLVVRLSPAVGTHGGPGLVGVVAVLSKT